MSDIIPLDYVPSPGEDDAQDPPYDLDDYMEDIDKAMRGPVTRERVIELLCRFTTFAKDIDCPRDVLDSFAAMAEKVRR